MFFHLEEILESLVDGTGDYTKLIYILDKVFAIMYLQFLVQAAYNGAR